MKYIDSTEKDRKRFKNSQKHTTVSKLVIFVSVAKKSIIHISKIIIYLKIMLMQPL